MNNIIEFLISIAGVMLCLSIVAVINGKMLKIKRQISIFKTIIVVLLFSVLAYINNRINISESTFLIHILINVCANCIIYKTGIIISFINIIIIYFGLFLGEVIMSLVLIFIPNIHSIRDLSDNIYLINLLSVLELIFVYALFLNKFCIHKVRKLINYLNNKIEKFYQIIVIIALVPMGLIVYRLTFDYTDLKSFATNVIIAVIFFGVTISLFIETMRVTKEKEKQEALMSYMAKYEDLIDSQRINRHEMLNNLVTLKSFKNKNSKAFQEVLDSLINTYDKNDLAGLQSIYNLPSGIKGLLYYKIHDIKSKGVDVVVNVGRDTISFFDKADCKTYAEICKMLGILLDNAGEASSCSSEKVVIIDIYKENCQIYVYIENSLKGKVDLTTINEKHVSTKGKNRGLGLFIVKGIVDKRECYQLIQEINEAKHFVTTLKIDIKSAKQ